MEKVAVQEVRARKLHPIPEVCVLLGVGRSTVYGLLKSGALQTVRIGRRTLVLEESIDAYIESLKADDED